MQVAIMLFPRMTALDAVGPYEVLQRVPSIDVVFVGREAGLIRTENDFLGPHIDATFQDVLTPDVVVLPGGQGSRALLTDAPTLEWVRTVHARTRFTTSVCSGSLVLAAAGLLHGLTAASHWGVLELLPQWGVIPSPERVVEHLEERIITAAGVSSGIDMALRLVELLVDRTAAEAAQLQIEYDPQPPFDSGSLAKASAAVRARSAAYGLLRA